MDMSITVGWNAAVEAGVTREEMDAWALRSHQRAVAAIDAGRFVEEIFPVEVTGPRRRRRTFEVDEHPRRDTTLERLAALKPLHPEIEGFSITAGNASGMNDGAAAMVVADAAWPRPTGSSPWPSSGPGPRPACAGAHRPRPDRGHPQGPRPGRARRRRRRPVGDQRGLRSTCVAHLPDLGIDEERVNVFGSGCSLGHPIATTGARMVISLAHELRRRGGGTGVAAMCAGGGMSTAVVLDVPPRAARTSPLC